MCLPSDDSSISNMSYSSTPTDAFMFSSDTLHHPPNVRTKTLYDNYNNNFINICYKVGFEKRSEVIVPVNDNTNLFEYWYIQNKSLEFLTACSSFNIKDCVSTIHSSDAYMSLQVFEFVYSLSRHQQIHFSNIMNNIQPHMITKAIRGRRGIDNFKESNHNELQLNDGST